MKKKLLLLYVIPLMIAIVGSLVGCSMANTPTSKVENLFTKYQKLDNDIDDGIEDVLNGSNLSDSQKDRYKKLLEKQYKNLTYQIKEETIDGNNATVKVEIEVTDFRKVLNELVYDPNIYTEETFNEEKITRLEQTKDKVKYTLELTLTKNETGEWILNNLSIDDIKKIQGMY